MSSTKILPKIVAVVGPTASGKTSLAIKLAKKFSGELISADSRQIYKEMDIGTAKDKSFPHHLMDIKKPTEIFNVAEFKKQALELINKITERDKLPILVGGTGLYINALLYNYDFNQKRGKKLLDFIIIGITKPRQKLVEDIEKRVDEQIKQGLAEEVRMLIKKYGEDAYALKNTIAYQELLPYLRQEITLEEATEEIKKDTRRYGKRQMTWFRPNKEIHWVKNYAQAKKLVQKFLSND